MELLSLVSWMAIDAGSADEVREMLRDNPAARRRRRVEQALAWGAKIV